MAALFAVMPSVSHAATAGIACGPIDDDSSDEAAAAGLIPKLFLGRAATIFLNTSTCSVADQAANTYNLGAGSTLFKVLNNVFTDGTQGYTAGISLSFGGSITNVMLGGSSYTKGTQVSLDVATPYDTTATFDFSGNTYTFPLVKAAGSTVIDGFTICDIPTAAPTITSITPANGDTTGGTSVTIEGSNFCGLTSVKLGGTTGTIISFTPTSITVTTPAHAAGDVDVVVANAIGPATEANGFTYDSAAPGADVVGITQEVIASFMVNRANFIVGNQPDLTDYLLGGNGQGGGPLGNLALKGTTGSMAMAFSTSLSKLDREREKATLALLDRHKDEAAGSAYANLPGTSPGTVSRLMNGKQLLSGKRTGTGIAEEEELEARMARVPEAAAADSLVDAYASDDTRRPPDDAASSLAALMPATDKPGTKAASAGDAQEVYGYGSMPERRYDIWTEVYGARSSAGDYEDSHWVGYLGGHYFVSPEFIVGGLVQVDWADEDNDSTNSSASGVGWMIGPYIAGRVSGSTLAYEARAAWGRSDSEVSPIGTYTDSFSTQRFLVSGKVQGSLQYAAVTVKPSLRVSWFEETQESYTDSLSNFIPEQTISLGEVRFGPEFSQTITLANGAVVTPSLGISGVWNFDVDTSVASSTVPLGDERLRARFDVGISMVNGMGWTLLASGYYDGVGIDDYDAVGGQVKLVIPLQ